MGLAGAGGDPFNCTEEKTERDVSNRSSETCRTYL